MKKINFWLGFWVLLALAGCKANKLDFVEPTKNISGEWKVVQITQNAVDITTDIDAAQLSDFKIKFDNNSYSLVKPIPFIVQQNGTWSFNDPQYPFAVSFVPTGGTPVKSELTYPIYKGKRAIIISFSTGCTNNAYTYLLTQ